jgi:DNA-binding CsgD family transcriptional regulator
MARLNAQHVREFGRVKELCYRGLESATLREQVGDRLSRHLGVSSYCFGATDPRTGLPVHSVSVGLEPAVMGRFFDLLLTTPSMDYGPWIESGRRTATLDQLVDDVDTDPYMTDILRPSGLRHETQVACVAGGWSWGHLCLRRRADDEQFAGHELRLLDALVPHLTAGLRAAAGRAPLGSRESSMTGVVVLDPDGKVEVTNALAERLFRQPVSGTRHSFLSAVHVVAAQLERSLSDPTSTTVPGVTMDDEASGAIYRLRAERAMGSDGRERGLVVIEPASPRNADDVAFALARRGLSRRECDVAVAVVRGRSNAEIAAEQFVSVHTVQDHVRSIFDKLGVSSRQQLAFSLLGVA